MKKIIIPFLSIFLSGSISLFAQNTLTLSDAIKIGLQNNFEISIARLTNQAAQQNVEIGVPQKIPSINFDLKQSNGISKDGLATSFLQGTYSKSEISAEINLDWILFDGFQAKINHNILKQLGKRSDGLLQLTIENTIESIILSYYNALIEKEKLKVFEEVSFLSSQKLKKARVELNLGEISFYDLNNLAYALVQDSINWYEQQINYGQAIIKLNTLMGVPKNQQPILVEQFEFENQDFDYNILRRKLLASNQDLQNEYINQKLQEQNATLLHAQKKPMIRLQSGIGEELGTSKFSGESRQKGTVFDYYVNFTLTYNLFNKRDLKQRIQEAEINKLIVNKEINQIKQILEEKLFLRYDKYQQYKEIFRMRKKLIESLHKNLKIASIRLDNGESLFIEYRDLQIKLLEAKLGLLDSIFELKIAETEIIRLTGGILKNR